MRPRYRFGTRWSRAKKSPLPIACCRRSAGSAGGARIWRWLGIERDPVRISDNFHESLCRLRCRPGSQCRRSSFGQSRDGRICRSGQRCRAGTSGVKRGQELLETSSSTEKPAASAASANRWSPQMKLLLEGRCPHQISEAASCKLSAALREYLSNTLSARSRTDSSGSTSLQPRLSSRKRAAAPRFSASAISPSRWSRQRAL